MGSTSRILDHLRSFHCTSWTPDRIRYLRLLIQHDKKEKYLTNLEEPVLTWLVDLLDRALDVIPTNDDFARECLQKLHAICADRGAFPSSHNISGELDYRGSLSLNPFGYWYRRGTYRGEEVDIINVMDGQSKKKLLADMIFALKMPKHPNLFRPIGVKMNHSRVVMEHIESLDLGQYFRIYPAADRIGPLLGVAEALDFIHMKVYSARLFTGFDVIVDYEGHARVTLAGPFSIKHSRDLVFCRNLVAPEVRSGSYSIATAIVFSFGILVIEAFTRRDLYDQFTDRTIFQITNGIRPDRPEGAEKLGLTDPLWETTVRCLHKDPTQRPNIAEVTGFLRKLSVSPSMEADHLEACKTQGRDGQGEKAREFLSVSLSMEADLHDFFEVCKTQGRDGQGGKAQEFSNELDKALDGTRLPQEKRKQYLRALQKLCSTFDHLPPSFLLPQGSVKLEATPFDSGGYSSVFKATFKERPVVVKVLNVAAQTQRQRLHRLLVKEVVGWKWLRHENVLPFVGVMLTPSAPISIASELMENGNITDFIRKNQDYNRVDLLVGAVTGLEYLHEHNIVHGDLKGVNILIDSERRARLGDFGLATIIDESTSRATTAVGKKPGTVRWMAPELLYPETFGFTGRLERQLPSKDTDIYAIGMTILEVITGRVPFASVRLNETVMLKAVKGDRPDRPSSGLSDALWDLLVTMWVEQYAQKPRERPLVSAVLTRLKRCIGDWGRSIVPLIPEDWQDIDASDDDDFTITAPSQYRNSTYWP